MLLGDHTPVCVCWTIRTFQLVVTHLCPPTVFLPVLHHSNCCRCASLETLISSQKSSFMRRNFARHCVAMIPTSLKWFHLLMSPQPALPHEGTLDCTEQMDAAETRRRSCSFSDMCCGSTGVWALSSLLNYCIGFCLAICHPETSTFMNDTSVVKNQRCLIRNLEKLHRKQQMDG